jgi:hypothetical protein
VQSIPANTSQTLCGRRHTHSFCIRLSGFASQARLDGITPTLRATGGPLWVVWQTPSGERLLSRGLHPYERLALQGDHFFTMGETRCLTPPRPSPPPGGCEMRPPRGGGVNKFYRTPFDYFLCKGAVPLCHRISAVSNRTPFDYFLCKGAVPLCHCISRMSGGRRCPGLRCPWVAPLSGPAASHLTLPCPPPTPRV